MNALSTIFPNVQRRGCRFHLGQSWWRRIQTLGMSEDYSDKNSAFRSGRCCFSGCRCCLRMKSVRHLLMKYCLPFRPDDRYRKFADYVVDHYIDPGCDFAPDLRASSPQQSPTTTNTAESFHSHMNADIKTPHPNIGLFNRSYVNRPLPTGTYWLTYVYR